MNRQEVMDEIAQDISELKRYAISACNNKDSKARRLKERFFRYTQYVHKSSQNKYLFTFRYDEDIKKTDFVFGIKVFENSKPMFVQVFTEGGIWFSKHFFDRYSEKALNQKLSLEETIAKYLNKNPKSLPIKGEELEKGRTAITYKIGQGLGLGDQTAKDGMTIRTFITNSQIVSGQYDLAKSTELVKNLIEKDSEKFPLYRKLIERYYNETLANLG